MSISFKHRLEYAGLRTAVGLISVLPIRAALALGWLVAALGEILGRQRIRVAEQRIREVLGPACTPARARRIAWQAWRNVVLNLVEMARSPRLTAADIRRRIDTSGIELPLAWSRERQGCIIAVGHFGNWELAGIGMSLLGLPLFSMVRRQNNPLIDADLNAIRTRSGMGVLERDSRAIAGIVRRLKSGEALGILPDLRAAKTGVGLGVEFLGGETAVPRGMGLFARHANVPIVLIFPRRISWTRHAWVAAAPIWPDLSLDKHADVMRMTQTVLDRLTDEVRARPEQYFWFNKRWVLDPVRA